MRQYKGRLVRHFPENQCKSGTKKKKNLSIVISGENCIKICFCLWEEYAEQLWGIKGLWLSNKCHLTTLNGR